jgi:beta-glucosidase-like glycosyl hydrolase
MPFIVLLAIAAAQLTFEELLGQINQWVPDQPGFEKALAEGKVGAMLGVGSAEQANALQRKAKVPLLIGHDVIHGYRTIFPVPLAMAASWNPSLAEEASRIAAKEARAGGIRWTFAPMVDIARDPRWGRIMEGAGRRPAPRQSLRGGVRARISIRRTPRVRETLHGIRLRRGRTRLRSRGRGLGGDAA